jgi:tRNA(Phe) wybutosine-synthesizing methylase Tyw3
VESAPLANLMGKASCVVATSIGNASCGIAMRLLRLAVSFLLIAFRSALFVVACRRLSSANGVVVVAVGCGCRAGEK